MPDRVLPCLEKSTRYANYGYFRFGNEITVIRPFFWKEDDEHGKEPSPKELSAIISKAKETGAKVIFVQPQFSEKSAAVIFSWRRPALP